MATKINLTTAERLTLVLCAVEPEMLRDELRYAFHLMNPIEFAGFLLSLELGSDVTRELLLIRVSVPPKYRGPELGLLLGHGLKGVQNNAR